MPIDVTLTKAKYRNPNRRMNKRQFDPPEGTWTFMAGSYKSKSSNQGGNKKATATIRPRKRAYGPF